MPKPRKHQRVIAPEGALALADDGNMCKIIDISQGGLSILFLDKSITDIPDKISLDLLSIENKIQANQIPGELAWVRDVSSPSRSGIAYKRVGIQFGSLTPQQKIQLEYLILNYTAGSA